MTCKCEKNSNYRVGETEGREPEVGEEGGRGEKALSQTVLHVATRGSHQPKTVWLLSGKNGMEVQGGWWVKWGSKDCP